MANIIGLTGQTGAGKSSVREILRQKGAAVIDADTVAHDITDNNVNCIYDIVNRFSCLVLNEKGKINRKALGKRAFSDKKELMALNKIIFPYILEAIERGVDMFDCVMPTRNGRNGMIFTSQGTINIKNKKWEHEFTPLDPAITSYVDEQYTLAYLHHLIKADELLGLQICSIHNLSFYLWLVRQAREHIIAGDYAAWKSVMVKRLAVRL